MIVRKEYEKSVDELKRELLDLTGIVNKSIMDSVDAVLDWDKKFATQIEANDDKIDELYIDYQQKCIHLIARYQPLANDLRFLEASLIVASNIERCGDYAVDIVKIMKWVETHEVAGSQLIKKMVIIGTQALQLAVESFVEADIKKIKKVKELEEGSDELYGKTFELFEGQVKKHPKLMRMALKEVLIAKNLERIADRAINITNRTIYFLTGKRESLR